MVDYPIENLELKKYIVGYNEETFIYDLYGVCNHSGMTMGGHYFVYVKMPMVNGIVLMIQMLKK